MNLEGNQLISSTYNMNQHLQQHQQLQEPAHELNNSYINYQNTIQEQSNYYMNNGHNDNTLHSNENLINNENINNGFNYDKNDNQIFNNYDFNFKPNDNEFSLNNKNFTYDTGFDNQNVISTMNDNQVIWQPNNSMHVQHEQLQNQFVQQNEQMTQEQNISKLPSIVDKEIVKDNYLSMNVSSMKKKKAPRKKDINKPQKPVSAYAHFFREKQTEIKTNNPDASFGEVSKIVAAEWDSLSTETKVIYKRRADQEKQDYLRTLATLKANSIAGNSKTDTLNNNLIQQIQISSPTKFEKAINGNNSTIENINSNTNQTNNITSQNTNNDQWLSDFESNIVWTPLPGELLTQTQQETLIEEQQQINNQQNINNNTRCIRLGCSNSNLTNQQWDNEYCSDDCAVAHCKNIFDTWLNSRTYSQ